MGLEMAMEMDEVARRWMYKTAKQQYWRVSAWYEFDDLIQDGYFWYYSRVKKYPHITEPRHMMRMFQIRYLQHIHELSNKKTKQSAEVHVELVGCTLVDQQPAPTALERAIADAPVHLRRVISTILDAPEQLRGYPKQNGVRETTNERFCRLAGVPTTNDVVKQLKDYLRGDVLPAV